MSPEQKKRKRENNRRYRERHKERLYELRCANRSKEAERVRAFYSDPVKGEARRQRKRETDRNYRKQNREKRLEKGRAYFAENRERLNASRKVRREAQLAGETEQEKLARMRSHANNEIARRRRRGIGPKRPALNAEELSVRAAERYRKWLANLPLERIAMKHARSILAVQSGINEANVPFPLVEAKAAQLLVTKMVKRLKSN